MKNLFVFLIVIIQISISLATYDCTRDPYCLGCTSSTFCAMCTGQIGGIVSPTPGTNGQPCTQPPCIISNCRVCLTELTCYECEDGFYVSATWGAKKCLPCRTGCSTCTNGKDCTTCGGT